MSPGTLIFRSFTYRLRSHLGVMLGAAAACAALTGALLVGDSMRGSLLRQALSRIGQVDFVVQPASFFRSDLGERLAADADFARNFRPPAVTLITKGAMLNPQSLALAANCQVLGVDALFWRADPDVPPELLEIPPDRSVVLSEPLARELGVEAGQEVVLRVSLPSDISSETLLGRREDRTVSMRLAVSRVVRAAGMGGFSLNTAPGEPRNAFLRLDALQRLLRVGAKANTMLVSARPEHHGVSADALRASLLRVSSIAEHGLSLRAASDESALVLESESLLLRDDVVAAARDASAALDASPAPVIAYLATTIRRVPGAEPDSSSFPEVPYSVIAGIPAAGSPLDRFAAFSAVESHATASPAAIKPGEVILNSWTAEQLGARPGDQVEIDYFMPAQGGELRSAHAVFRVAHVLPLEGAATDATFTPEYQGVTNARRITDWDPPFPMDLRRIRPADERYWDDYRTAPKLFMTLEDAQRLFVRDPEILGRYSSLRVYPQRGAADRAFRDRFAAALIQRLNKDGPSLQVRDLRSELLRASEGPTDFAGLFLGFSFFLIAAAVMLLALLFRLGVEQRAAEVGVLLALGWARSLVLWSLVCEGILIALAGALLGLPLAIAYARLMLHGLRTWWAAGVQAPFLELFIPWTTLAIGATVSLLVAAAAMTVSLRGLLHRSPRALLAADLRTEHSTPPSRFARRNGVLPAMFGAAAIGLALIGFFNTTSQALLFFGAGAAALVAFLLGYRALLAHGRPRATLRAGARDRALSMRRFIMQNLARSSGRSLATISLLACATFLLAAIQSFRLSPPDEADVHSGTGGFAWVAESSVPVIFDLNTPAGRAAAGLPPDADEVLERVRIWPFRLRAGDEVSCRSLYTSRQPRILGAPAEFVRRGGFAFASQQNERGASQHNNPWLLLEQASADDVTPAIGDEAAVRWQLHSGLGQRLNVQDGDGDATQLAFVALLAGSALQSELIISEARFRALFPRIEGYQFFLVEAKDTANRPAVTELERALWPLGADVRPTSERIAAYFAVQNTYLATFQMVGGFGLLLGALGLAAVMLRNVLERRRELALLQAVGWTRNRVATLVYRESLWLLGLGIAAGLLAAVIAVLPALYTRSHLPALLPLIGLIALVSTVGAVAGLVAMRSVLRMRLITALRSE